jgi:TRAP-type C4-dicarboxylate transport system substrate-binding protein
MESRKRKFSLARVVMVLAVLTGIVLTNYSQAADKPIVLRYAGNFPIQHFMTTMMNDWAKLVEQRSNNRVKIEVYPAGQLYTDKDLDRALVSGAVDLGQAQANVLAGISPAMHLLDFAMVWDNWDHFDSVMHKGDGFKIMDEEARTHNMKEIFIMPYGNTLGPITAKKKITVHQDMKGLTIRAMGGSLALTLKALGATPVFLSSGEVYQALQRGTIDGAVSGLTSMQDRTWGEVTKYLWMLYFCPTTSGHTVANLNSWNKLPADIQKIMLDTGREIELKYRNGVVEKENADALAALKKAGVEIVYPTPEEIAATTRLVKPVIDEWAKKSKWSKAIIDLAEKGRGKK